MKLNMHVSSFIEMAKYGTCIINCYKTICISQDQKIVLGPSQLFEIPNLAPVAQLNSVSRQIKPN